MPKFGVIVEATGKNVRRESFACEIHRTERPEDRLVDPEFYEKYTPGGPPQGVHFEMEILDPMQIEMVTNVSKHIRPNPHTGRHFLCWTGHIPTPEMAWSIFLTWTAGVMYTLVHKEDFVPLYKYKGDLFLDYLKAEYGISHVWTTE